MRNEISVPDHMASTKSALVLDDVRSFIVTNRELKRRLYEAWKEYFLRCKCDLAYYRWKPQQQSRT